MGKHIDIGYFNNKLKIRSKVANKRSIINKIEAWELGREYYDGKRINGYGGFNMMEDGLNYSQKSLKNINLTKIQNF